MSRPITDISSLVPTLPVAVETDCGTVVVNALQLGVIAELMVRHPMLFKAFTAAKSGDSELAVAAIMNSGQTAVSDIIDSACGLPAGKSQELHFGLVDQTSILINALDLTIPKDEARLEKLVVQLDQVLNRLGLNEVEENPLPRPVTGKAKPANRK